MIMKILIYFKNEDTTRSANKRNSYSIKSIKLDLKNYIYIFFRIHAYIGYKILLSIPATIIIVASSF